VRTLKFNGEYWYRAPALLKRIQQWAIWVGGWEKPGGLGWRFNGSPTPVSVLGHRLTVYGWGFQVRVPSGLLVVTWPHGSETSWRAFVSPNGTPQHATEWIMGAPEEIRMPADERFAELRARYDA
jgi:hypothetical protein